MRFNYIYKTSDGVRHEAWIESPSRNEAFAALRERGIRPIKVVAEDGSRANGEVHGVRRRIAVATGVLCLLLGALIAWLAGRPAATDFYRADGTVGTSGSGLPAQAMTRRQIHGDVEKVRSLLAGDARYLFRHPGEVLLARYAQPGEPVSLDAVAGVSVEALDADLAAALNEPVYTFPGEMAECVELKGIVAGMKEELRMFRAAGGSIAEYLARLEERQRMEVDYREQAALKLADAARAGDAARTLRVWKEQNGWLRAMGIAQLPLPSGLPPEGPSEEK